MNASFTIAFQVGVMFILILFGFFCYKLGFITNRANKQLSNIVITLVTPAIMFVSYQKEFDMRLARGLLISFVLAAVSHFVLIAFGTLFIKKEGNANWNVERFACVYSNCGFMGIPLMEALYGSDGIFYLTAYITVFNIMMWTHGVITIREVKDSKAILKALKSPAIIATVLGIMMFLLQITLPQIIMKPLNYIASLNTPLAMLVSGVTIAQTHFFTAVKKPRVYLIALLKLLVVPIILLLIFKPFNISEPVLNSAIIAAGCPTAAATIMFAYKYKKDAIYASEIFVVSTLLAAFTLPLVIFVSGLL